MPNEIDYDQPTNNREIEMARLLDLIDAEWQRDPMSVACFDRRIIEDVRKALADHRRRKAIEAKYLRAFR